MPRSITTKKIFVLMAALWLSACSANINRDVQYEFNASAPFGHYNTFAVEYVPAMEHLPRIQGLLKSGMEKTLEAKGYRQVPAKQADLLVRFGTRLEQSGRLTQEIIPFGQGLRTRYGLEPLMQGKLLVNVVDTKDGVVIWKAAMQKPLDGIDLSQVTQEQVDAGMKRLFEPFPEQANP